ncbi:Uncharacterised protein [Mycobacteroides abscessus subsp. abscessus]|nr:Uncharacterised protein [Mycobacteroides abscessus subsp. abscessus]
MIGARYSSAKTSQISLGFTSPPSPSVMRWIDCANSICRRRGSTSP